MTNSSLVVNFVEPTPFQLREVSEIITPDLVGRIFSYGSANTNSLLNGFIAQSVVIEELGYLSDIEAAGGTFTCEIIFNNEFSIPITPGLNRSYTIPAYDPTNFSIALNFSGTTQSENPICVVRLYNFPFLPQDMSTVDDNASTAGVVSVNGQTGVVTLTAASVGAATQADINAAIAEIPPAPVQSVNNKTGAVILGAADVGAATPASLAELQTTILQIVADNYLSLNGGSLNGGLLINTENGQPGLVISGGDNANGAGILFEGNGNAATKKTLRVQGGQLQIINSDYTNSIFGIDDLGDLYITTVTPSSGALADSQSPTLQQVIDLIANSSSSNINPMSRFFMFGTQGVEAIVPGNLVIAIWMGPSSPTGEAFSYTDANGNVWNYVGQIGPLSFGQKSGYGCIFASAISATNSAPNEPPMSWGSVDAFAFFGFNTKYSGTGSLSTYSNDLNNTFDTPENSIIIAVNSYQPYGFSSLLGNVYIRFCDEAEKTFIGTQSATDSATRALIIPCGGFTS